MNKLDKFNELYAKIIMEMNEANKKISRKKRIIKENIRHKHSYITPDGKIDYSDLPNYNNDDGTEIGLSDDELNANRNDIISSKTSDTPKENLEDIPDREIELEVDKDNDEYMAIFSFEEGTEIRADNFLDCKKAAYKYAIQQSDRTEIRIFDPSGKLVLSTLYSKEGFDNRTHFKKIKGDEF